MEEYTILRLYDYFKPLRDSLTEIRSLSNYKRLTNKLPLFFNSLNEALKNNLSSNGFFDVFNEEVRPFYEKKIFNGLSEAITLWKNDLNNKINDVKEYVANEWRELNNEFNDFRDRLIELLPFSSGLELIDLIGEAHLKLTSKKDEKIKNIHINAVNLLMKEFNKGLYNYCNKVALILEPYIISINQESHEEIIYKTIRNELKENNLSIINKYLLIDEQLKRSDLSRNLKIKLLKRDVNSLNYSLRSKTFEEESIILNDLLSRNLSIDLTNSLSVEKAVLITEQLKSNLSENDKYVLFNEEYSFLLELSDNDKLSYNFRIKLLSDLSKFLLKQSNNEDSLLDKEELTSERNKLYVREKRLIERKYKTEDYNEKLKLNKRLRTLEKLINSTKDSIVSEKQIKDEEERKKREREIRQMLINSK